MNKENTNKNLAWLGILVVILVSSNLRSPITAVSPILDEIKNVFHLDNLEASLLTSIPLFVFATCSILVSKAAAKINIRTGLLISLIILIVGLYIRIYGNVATLFAGSLILGLGICIGNVLTPAYIKNIFPNKIGIMTGVFSVAMSLVAALASGLSIDLGKWTGMEWKGSLGIWIIGGILALIVVSAELMTGKKTTQTATSAIATTKFNIFKSKQAWSISIFMGLQSLVYYCLVALLPTVLVDFGMQKSETGWVLFVLQMAMLPVMLFSPVLATKMKNQKNLIYLTGGLFLIGLLMLTILKSQLVYVSATLIGIAGGLAFSLSILFFSLRTKTMYGTIKISGKSQSVGYLIAACGPPIFGKLHDWDISWQYSFYFLIICVLIMTYFGKKASEPRYIEDH
ncbi:MFS transporter [Soonwooa sp.]|uniref:CynX/NimT family MFS transporter n=1 Tax=Soonwooa sp. TaxID=1938592 RepID=UPI0026052FF0|nr:MFS transporter [Soonwooa sp.]